MSTEEETRKKRRKSHEIKQEEGEGDVVVVTGDRMRSSAGPWSAVVALAKYAKELRDEDAWVAELKGTTGDGMETEGGMERRMSGGEAGAGPTSGGKRSRAEMDGVGASARSEWRGTLLGSQSRGVDEDDAFFEGWLRAAEDLCKSLFVSGCIKGADNCVLANLEVFVERAFGKSSGSVLRRSWPRCDKQMMEQILTILPACAKAFAVSNGVRLLKDLNKHWAGEETKLIESWCTLLSVNPRTSKTLDVVSPKNSQFILSTLKKLLEDMASGHAFLTDEYGRNSEHLRAIMQAMKFIIASFEYCAQAVYDVVLQPLRTFSAATVSPENFVSDVHFVSWLMNSVHAIAHISEGECVRERMNAYVSALNDDYSQFARRLMEFFYHQLSNVKTALQGLPNGMQGLPKGYSSENAIDDLCSVILRLSKLKVLVPHKSRTAALVDPRLTDRFKRKLARYAVGIISGSIETLRPIVAKRLELADALVGVIVNHKSNSVKESMRDIVLKLNVHEILVEVAKSESKSASGFKAVEKSLSQLAAIMSVNPFTLTDANKLVKDLVPLFGYRQKLKKPDLRSEANLCTTLACIAAGDNSYMMDALAVKVSSMECSKVVQDEVMEHFDIVRPVILDLLNFPTMTKKEKEARSRSKLTSADIPFLAMPAIGALTMFARGNSTLRDLFANDGATSDRLIKLLESKDSSVSRITSACVLSFEEHHRLVHNLYKPSVNTDKKRERVTEISEWDVEKLRRSLRALAELVKDSPPSSLGFDNHILEIICSDRRMHIYTSKLKIKLDSLGLGLDRFPDSKVEMFLRKIIQIFNDAPQPEELDEEAYFIATKEFWDVEGRGELSEEALHDICAASLECFTSLKKSQAKDDDMSDICGFLMEGDTDGRSSHVGIVVPILTLLHKCRILQEHNLVSEMEVPGISEIEKEACYVIGLLATKTSNQNQVASSFKIDSKNGIDQLIPLLKRYHPHTVGSAGASVARRAADAITNLAHENNRIKTMVRDAGGIPPIVKLLDAQDPKVQRAAASALRTLAFKNNENKNQIVECGALPKLIFMIRSDDSSVHKEAIGVIGNLVHSSAHIKRRVLDEGALQPVIELLKSTCSESQREAALLIGQFAARLDPTPLGDPDFRTKIVQRGAMESLIKMLSHREPGLREMAAFALGRLAQLGDNQVGICYSNGLSPLLNLLETDVDVVADRLRIHPNGKSDSEIESDAKRIVENLQHNAAFAIYGVSANSDNVSKMIKHNAFMRLKYSELSVEASKTCVTKTLKRLEDNSQRAEILNYLAYVVSTGKPLERQRMTLALAWLCKPENLRLIFIEKCGLKVLSDILLSGSAAESVDLSQSTSRMQGGARVVNVVLEALREIKSKLVPKVSESLASMPPPSTPTAEEHLPFSTFRDPDLCDVTFAVTPEDGDGDGSRREYKAHRMAFTHASDAFLALLDSGERREDDSTTIDLSDVRSNAFESMMDFIYSGTVRETSSLRDHAFLRGRLEEVLSLATRFELKEYKDLIEKSFVEFARLDDFGPKEMKQTYRAACKHDAVVIQDAIVAHVIDTFDSAIDPTSALPLSRYRNEINAIINIFGEGMIRYIDKILRQSLAQGVASPRRHVAIAEIAMELNGQ